MKGIYLSTRLYHFTFSFSLNTTLNLPVCFLDKTKNKYNLNFIMKI
jgi:hypothetical protein